MRKMYEKVAGLDVHKKTVVGCRMRVVEGKKVEREVKTFGTKTRELLKLYDWLEEWDCEQVAMESTANYWKPVYNILEEGYEVYLVNARHVKKVPGRKTDVGDAEWLAELMMYGLLKASFIPPRPQRVLRELTRYRSTLVREKARVINRIQKQLEEMNIKLSSVVTDVTGVSAKAMLKEIARGTEDVVKLAELAKGRLRAKRKELEEALRGRVKEHHRFILAKQLSHIDFLDEQIEQVSQEIEHHLSQMSLPPTTDKGEGKQVDKETGEIDDGSPSLSWEKAVTLLDTIPGVDRRTAEIILAEIGLDMSHFPTADELTSWAGLAPGNHQSGGKRYSGRTTKGNKALRNAMSQAAWAASRTKGTFLKARYHRLAARRGKKRAIVATARAMLESVWFMLSRQEVYRDLGEAYYDHRKKDKKVSSLTKQLTKLGFQVSLSPLPVTS